MYRLLATVVALLAVGGIGGIAHAQGAQGMRGTYWKSLTKLGSNPCGASEYCLYMRTSDGHLIYSNSAATTDLSAGGSSTLALTYAAGAAQADSTMTLDSTRLGVRILDAASTITTLFTVANNAASTNYFSLTSNAQQLLKSGMADGASAVGLAVDTTAAWSNATSKPLRILTGGSERFSVTGSGNINLVANASIVGASASTNTTSLTATTNVADGASSIGLLVNNSTTLANATAELADFQNNGTSKFRLLVGSAQYAGSMKLGGLGAPTYTLVVGTDLGAFLGSNVGTMTVSSGANDASIFIGESSSTGYQQLWSHTNNWGQINTTGAALVFSQSGTLRLQIDTSGNTIPGADATYTLGLVGTKWQTAFVKRIAHGTQNMSFSATPAFDCTAGNIIHIGTITANVTGPTMVAGSPGERCTIVFLKDGTAGTFTIAGWGTNTRTAGTLTFTSGASSLVTISFVWDDRLGTAAWVETSRTAFN